MKSLLNRYTFIKFIITGGLGTITNLIVFATVLHNFDVNINFISSISFLIATVQNFLINNYFTFNNVDINFPKYLKFLFSCLIGLTTNLIILNFLIYLFSEINVLYFQLIGIICGSFINYYFSKKVVFKLMH